MNIKRAPNHMDLEIKFKESYQWVAPASIILIMSAVFLCFYPILQNGFVWDDEYNLVLNPKYRGLSWSHLQWMFTTFHDRNYHPLSWLSLGLDYRLWGMNPGGYHFTDLVLHGVNAILFYWLLTALFAGSSSQRKSPDAIPCRIGAVAGTLFFALHPLRVESVAWISTRGDTLCGVFYLLTIITYLKSVEQEKIGFKNRWYWLSLMFYTCSLLSRAWGITLPLVLMILDLYPLKRMGLKDILKKPGRKMLLEKMGFALPAMSFGVAALLAKSGSMAAMADHGILDRTFQSFYGIGFYIWKTVIPADLSPLYVLRDVAITDPQNLLSTAFVVSVTIGLVIMGRRWPFAITAWVSYIIIASPLLGFVQSGPQAVADRYTYFSCLPFAILFGAGIRRVLGNFYSNVWKNRTMPFIVLIVAMGLLGVLGSLSFQQTGVWRDGLSFWNRIVALDPKNEIAVNERARLKFESIGDLKGAEADYNLALEIRPGNTDALVSRGLVRMGLKNFSGASEDFMEAVELERDKPEIYNGLGLLYQGKGEAVKALKQYDIAIALKTDFADAYNNRGLLQKRFGNVSAAIEDFSAAIRYAPHYPEAYVNRGVIRMEQNKPKEAASDFSIAMQLLPENMPIRLKLEETLKRINPDPVTED